MATILLVENQERQYEVIAEKLRRANFGIYPDQKHYEKFMDKVCIYLDKRSHPVRANNAKIELLAELDNLTIDLFLFDYKIAVNHDDSTGVALAAELQSHQKYENVPVIFLSQSPLSSINREKVGLNVVKKYEWIEKGYAGITLEEPGYFHKNITAKIPDLIKTDPPINYEEILGRLLDRPMYQHDKAYKKLEQLLQFAKESSLSDTHKILIAKLMEGKNEGGKILDKKQIEALFLNHGL